MKQRGSYFEIAELVTKFLEGKLSQDESEKLKAWINENEEHQRIWQRITDPVYLEKRLQYWENKNTDIHWKTLNAELSRRSFTRRSIFHKTMKYAAIALPLLLVLGVGWYFLGQKEKKQQPVVQTATLTGVHILPKGKIARLVLGNGQVVNLNDSLHKTITEKDGTKVSNHGSTLHYLSHNQGKETKVIFNTLMTPRGGEYQIVLADGTKVWLNAASTLRFPTQFNDEERKVYLSGEAYFEVAPHPQPFSPKGRGGPTPFIVNTGKMDVTVLGTKFNVSAYADDAKQIATLAEGAVRVKYGEGNKNSNGILLKPGYEAVVTESNNKIQVNKANVKAALAWKNGLFIFNSETLGHIMRTLSRWYDVEVRYEDGVDTLLHFTGRIRKYKNITGILKKLEMTGKVQFNVEGKEVSVTHIGERQKH